MPDINKVLVFDVWGDYAHFRRGYTTTSPLTYPFPPRTALSGMIAAIIGLPRDSYYNLFSKDNSAIALQIINPIKRIKITQNLIDTKTGFYLWDNKGQRTQIPFEYLKEPKYRIYLWMKENLDDLARLLKEHKSIYTPYLGISECIANFKYIDILEVEPKYTEDEIVEISSIIKNSNDIKIVLEEGKRYGKIKIPGFMDNNRVIQDFLEMIYEEDGKKIKIISGNYYKVIGKNIDVNVILF
ncbi:MAG: type I-B CRISPR-associated protein Cas5b [Caldisericia bacterium]|jgi:CRISPR-associated protein Cas5h|nr:type I-B CRISPR-associated protein Cas5b [Caldisericia bacterium]